MFEGYWGRPEVTVETSRNWWYHTGDIGRIDEDRYLYFVDRKADYLRRRGENISSFEVESVLMSHGALADVAVHAVPSQLSEDDLKVTAVIKANQELTADELFGWCIAQLPYFALPRYIEFRDDLPRSPVGRVLKRELREEGVTPDTWDAEAAGIRVRAAIARARSVSGRGRIAGPCCVARTPQIAAGWLTCALWPAPAIVNNSAPSDSASLVAASWAKGHVSRPTPNRLGTLRSSQRNGGLSPMTTSL